LLQLPQEQCTAAFETLFSNSLKSFKGHSGEVWALHGAGALPHALESAMKQGTGKEASIYASVRPATHTVCKTEGRDWQRGEKSIFTFVSIHLRNAAGTQAQSQPPRLSRKPPGADGMLEAALTQGCHGSH